MPDNFFEPFYASMIELTRDRIDHHKHVELLKVGLRAGDDQAAYALGSFYLHGSDTPELEWKVDVKRGLKLFHQAARSVHLAMTELATLYEGGEFTLKVNEKKAFELFSRAVEFGSVSARFHLGRCHYFGVGTKVNKRRANTLFAAAFRLGFPVPTEGGPEEDG